MFISKKAILKSEFFSFCYAISIKNEQKSKRISRKLEPTLKNPSMQQYYRKIKLLYSVGFSEAIIWCCTM